MRDSRREGFNGGLDVPEGRLIQTVNGKVSDANIRSCVFVSSRSGCGCDRVSQNGLCFEWLCCCEIARSNFPWVSLFLEWFYTQLQNWSVPWVVLILISSSSSNSPSPSTFLPEAHVLFTNPSGVDRLYTSGSLGAPPNLSRNLVCFVLGIEMSISSEMSFTQVGVEIADRVSYHMTPTQHTA